jgi:hypothetical protein
MCGGTEAKFKSLDPVLDPTGLAFKNAINGFDSEAHIQSSSEGRIVEQSAAIVIT